MTKRQLGLNYKGTIRVYIWNIISDDEKSEALHVCVYVCVNCKKCTKKSFNGTSRYEQLVWSHTTSPAIIWVQKRGVDSFGPKYSPSMGSSEHRIEPSRSKNGGIFATSWPNTSFSRKVVTDNIPDLYFRGYLFESQLGHTLSFGLQRVFSFLQTNAGSLNTEQVTTASFQTLSNSLLQQSSNHKYSKSEMLDTVVKQITKHKCSKNLVSVGGAVPVSIYIICNICRVWFSLVRVIVVP